MGQMQVIQQALELLQLKMTLLKQVMWVGEAGSAGRVRTWE